MAPVTVVHEDLFYYLLWLLQTLDHTQKRRLCLAVDQSVTSNANFTGSNHRSDAAGSLARLLVSTPARLTCFAIVVVCSVKFQMKSLICFYLDPGTMTGGRTSTLMKSSLALMFNLYFWYLRRLRYVNNQSDKEEMSVLQQTARLILTADGDWSLKFVYRWCPSVRVNLLTSAASTWITPQPRLASS